MKLSFFYMLLCAGLAGLLFEACTSKGNEPYSAKRIPQPQHDSLLVQMIAHVYSLPEHQRGFNPERLDGRFRPYFQSQMSKFDFRYYHIQPDSTYLFFMIRPARNAKNYDRGVGGKFKLCPDNKICDFEEVFVTPYLPADSLQMRGKELFNEFAKSGNVDMYLPNPLFIEWPAAGSYYDKEKLEWRYRTNQDTLSNI